MNELKFKNPVGLFGRFSTVRKGRREGLLSDLLECRDVALTTERKEGGFFDSFAHIEEVVFTTIGELTMDDIYDNHDRRCRTVEGLYRVLMECYPGIQVEDDITIVRLRGRKPTLPERIAKFFAWT